MTQQSGKTRARHVAAGAAIAFFPGVVITVLSIETVVSEPREDLPEHMTLITPVGPYMAGAGIITQLAALALQSSRRDV